MRGRLAQPPNGAVFVIEADSPEVVERFVAADPYVKNGLVTGWRARPWTTVVIE
jgi:hypothetical protein